MKDGLYAIGEFASLLGVSKAVIYKWEKEGKINKAKRVKRGKTMYRYYTADDIRDIRIKMNLQTPMTKKRKQLFLNFKGGTGKSVISANYGYRLGQHGFKACQLSVNNGDLGLAYVILHSVVVLSLSDKLLSHETGLRSSV